MKVESAFGRRVVRDCWDILIARFRIREVLYKQMRMGSTSSLETGIREVCGFRLRFAHFELLFL